MTQPYSSQDEHYSLNKQTKTQQTKPQKSKSTGCRFGRLYKEIISSWKKKTNHVCNQVLFVCFFLTCLFMTDSLTKDSQCCFESKHMTEVCDIFCPWHITVNYVSLHDSHPNKSQIV